MKKSDLLIGTLLICMITLASLVFHKSSLAGPSQGQPQTPLMTDSAVSSAFVTGQVAMSDTATSIKSAPAAGHYRYSITVKNVGSNTVWIGPANTVTKSTGFALSPGQWYTLDRSYSAVYGICDTGLTSTAAYIEESK